MSQKARRLSMKMSISRRELLGGSAAALAAVNVSSAAPRADDDTSFHLGVASYSFRKLSRAEAIRGMEALQCRYINIKEFHAPLKATTAELVQARKDFESAGIKILGVGNVSFANADE